MNQISLGQEDGATEDEDCRLQTNLLVEGVETRSGQNKATDVWQAREQVDGQGDSSLAPVAYQELDSSLLGCVLRWLLP